MAYLLLLALLVAAPVAAQQEYAGRVVAEVRFDPASQPLLPDRLREVVTVQPGQALDLQQVSASIERMYATGRYEDIVAEAERVGERVTVTFRTRPAYFIGQVSVEGVPDPPNAGQLVNAAKLPLGTLYSESLVRRAVENLQELLRANGLYQAQIRSETVPHPDVQQIDILFTVEPGERAEFRTPLVKGNPGRTDEQIVKATRWHKFFGFLGWKDVTEQRTQAGLDRVRRSYQKKDRLLARATLDAMAYDEDTNTASPQLTIEGGPKVRVRTEGAKLSRGRLQELIPIYQEQAVDRDLLLEGQRNITDNFQAQGYFDAATSYVVRNPNPAEQEIVYTIDRGERYRLRELRVTGNRYFDEQTIRERMAIQPATFLRYRNGRFSDDLLERDVGSIEGLYRSNGFRDANVTSRVDENFGGKPQDVAVTLAIEEGPQSFVESIDLQGVSAENDGTVRSLLSSTPGQPYSELNVAADRDAVLNWYFNNGYPDATFEATARPAGSPTRFALTYQVAEGDRQFVRDVVVSGLKTTKRALVDDRISLRPGQPLSQSEIIESQRRLYDLGIFARVDTAIQNPDGDEAYKYVLYNMEEARRYSVNVGLGAQIARIGGGGGRGNLFAPAGSPGFSPRASFGVSRSNLFGVGHTVGIQTRLSNIEKRGLLTYLAPQFIGRDDITLTITGVFEDSRNINTFSVRRLETSAQLSQRLSRANTLQARLTYRQVRASDVAITPALIPILSQPARIGLVSATFIQDRRDDPIDSTRGHYNSIDGGVAHSALGSQSDFTRLLARNTTYHRVSRRRELVVARTLTFGLLDRFGGREVPLPERFFSGGASSHRGFPENQAGPRDDATGFPLGGRAILIHGTELRFPLLGENIGGVLFHDMGNVYSAVSDISFRFSQRELPPLQEFGTPRFDYNYTVHAVGFGLRYRTPVGPVRVDLAYVPNAPRFFGCQGTIETLLTACDPTNPANRPNFQEQRVSRLQFHFSLGQTF